MAHKGDLVIIGISAGVAIGIFIASFVFFGIRWYKRRAHLRRCANEHSTTLPIRTNGLDTSIDSSASLSNSITVKGSDYLAKSSQLSWWSHHNKNRFASASGIPRYSYKDIQKATENFTTILGQGSFGPVYKATIPAGGVVAVKVLASNSKQGEKEFQTEVSLLGRLHHRNLVNLVGYCVDKGQHMLIYEFMSNGSLANLLYSEEEQIFSWEERLQIALDISHGIEYLHDGAVPPVIHRDLKSANILLDQSMRAKVADFGLSKEEVFDGRNSGLKGTYGYIDPMYISTNKFTMKSDIYSFGIILFELITAIHPHQNLMEYINLAGMSSDGVDEILDKQLVGKSNLEEVRSLASIAHKCLHNSPRKRPSIGEVSQAILKIKQRRLAKEATMSFAGENYSRAVSRIEHQQVELRQMASINERVAVV
uniref:Protein kinase domain-containing protein n=1 Tax=Davidia involucrata TaxID=16924 RepID=A0A5B7A535_DAVIN